jgi:aminoglycoside N3'-acetyltransferase
MGVLREMAWDPVEDDAEASLVRAIDEVAELIRSAEAARRSEVARHLIAP